MKKIILFILLTLFIISTIVISCCGCAAANTPAPLETPEIKYNKQEIIDKVDYYEQRMEYANQIRVGALGLGYTYEDDIVKLAFKEWNEAIGQKAYYQSILNEILAEEALWNNRMKEYPAATTTWLYLKDLGYSDYICAGILGNMMAECGGHTLALEPSIIGDNWFYGICQWSKSYYPEVWGTDLEYQLAFLDSTLEEEFNSFGKLYKRYFNYAKFIALTDEKEVALAFAQVYERCNPSSYSIRQHNATIAYNYYTNK